MTTVHILVFVLPLLASATFAAHHSPRPWPLFLC